MTVQAQVVRTLREAIMVGRFRPGERLTEAALCALTGVSRTSIREALRRLEGERLVVIEPNRGPSVAEITWMAAEDIYRVRALLEAEAAALLAVRVTPDEVRKMQRALDGYGRATARSSTIDRLVTTSQFYHVLLSGCGNTIIQEVLESMLARINLLRSRSMSRPGRSDESLKEMRAMLSAIAARDPDAARRATLGHIKAARLAAFEALHANTAPEPLRRLAVRPKINTKNRGPKRAKPPMPTRAAKPALK